MPNLMEIAFGSAEQARQDTHESAMRTIGIVKENMALSEANNALQRYHQMFTKMKSEYDKLSENYDYVVADRDASQMVLKELREAAGIPREVVGQKIDSTRSALLQQEGLSHLIDKF